MSKAKKDLWMNLRRDRKALGLRQSEPYLHDGRALPLESVFTHHNPDNRHGYTSNLSDYDIHCLSEFLRYLEPEGPKTSQKCEDLIERTSVPR